MVSDELRDRIAKNELLRDKIVNYVLKYFFWGYEGITVEEISITITKMKLQNLYNSNEKVEEFIILPDDIGDGATALTTGNYQELEKMVEDYRQEEIEIEKLKSDVSNVPDYLQRLINVGLVYPPDGRKVAGKLDDVAIFLVEECKINITIRFLQKTFLKYDGSKWSNSAARWAIELAYADKTRKDKMQKRKKRT